MNIYNYNNCYIIINIIIKMKIYSVYYYNLGNSYVTVKFSGMYDNLEEAKDRLQRIIPNYKRYINNTVTNHGKIGWINENNTGDFDSELSASQPHSSINLFF